MPRTESRTHRNGRSWNSCEKIWRHIRCGRHCAFLYDYKFLWSSISYPRNKRFFFFIHLLYFLY